MKFTASKEVMQEFVFLGRKVNLHTMYLNFHGKAISGYGYEVYVNGECVASSTDTCDVYASAKQAYKAGRLGAEDWIAEQETIYHNDRSADEKSLFEEINKP